MTINSKTRYKTFKTAKRQKTQKAIKKAEIKTQHKYNQYESKLERESMSRYEDVFNKG